MFRPDNPIAPAPARGRGPRRDALVNRAKLLAAAASAVRVHGEKVPMAEIAEQAGVGVATLYRNFATREALLSAVMQHSLEGVLQRVTDAAATDGPAIEAVRRFLHETIRHRDELTLPLHGAPVIPDSRTLQLQRQIRTVLQEILDRGRADGSVLADVTPQDLIITGAQLAQPLAHVSGWDHVSRRQAAIFLAGLTIDPQETPS